MYFVDKTVTYVHSVECQFSARYEQGPNDRITKIGYVTISTISRTKSQFNMNFFLTAIYRHYYSADNGQLVATFTDTENRFDLSHY